MNIIHAAIVSGAAALKAFIQLTTAAAASSAPSSSSSSSPSHVVQPATFALTETYRNDFSAFLIAFSSASTTLDANTLTAANQVDHLNNNANSNALNGTNATNNHANSNTARNLSTEDIFGFVLIDGEAVTLSQANSLRVETDANNVIVSSSRGLLILTNYRLIYRDYTHRDSALLTHISVPPSTDIPLAVIHKLTQSNATSIRIHCKDLRNVTFSFETNAEWIEELSRQITRAAFCEDQSQLFAFIHKPQAQQQPQPQQQAHAFNGWTLYNAEREYKRLGLIGSPEFRLSTLNASYGVCASYPSSFIVPAAVSDSTLHNVASYRSQHRLPAIIWKHPLTHATLTRCSQPLGGMRRKRSTDDEYMLQLLHTQTSSSCLYIIDARPFRAAFGNSVMGKGYENIDNYINTKLEFCNIDNIHIIRQSLNKLTEISLPNIYYNLNNNLNSTYNHNINNTHHNNNELEESSWLTRLDSTQWLHYVRLMLSAAARTATLLCDETQSNSVLVHCSDGWDRTCQLCSLTLIMLDPYYRTFNGFAVLVEREWCSFGHQFAERYGHASSHTDNPQRSPIFLQWLDCVHQLLRYYPLAFEYNDLLLIDLWDSVLNCRFGTFLYDSERQRIMEQKVPQRTVSVWTYLYSVQQIHLYKNLLYNPMAHRPTPPLPLADVMSNGGSASHHQSIPFPSDIPLSSETYSSACYCIPAATAKRVVFWERMFLRWDANYVRSILPSIQHSYNDSRDFSKYKARYEALCERLRNAGIDPSAYDDVDPTDVAIRNESEVRAQQISDQTLAVMIQHIHHNTPQQQPTAAPTTPSQVVNGNTVAPPIPLTSPPLPPKSPVHEADSTRSITWHNENGDASEDQDGAIHQVQEDGQVDEQENPQNIDHQNTANASGIQFI